MNSVVSFSPTALPVVPAMEATAAVTAVVVGVVEMTATIVKIVHATTNIVVTPLPPTALALYQVCTANNATICTDATSTYLQLDIRRLSTLRIS
jgi:hypothetical protein